MARSIWSGTISFGLISIPVKLFTAVRHKGVSFNQLDDRNMGRIRYQKVSEQTGEEVPSDQIVKGYEISKGRYVLVDPDELAPFVPAGDEDDRPRGVRRPRPRSTRSSSRSPTTWPRTSARSRTSLLARALESSGKVAIARFVMRNRQYTAAIRADEQPARHVHARLRR